jgi:hypothetical protein
MGVVKSPGKFIPVKKSGPAPANLPADNENKDIYFEKDFGDKKAKWVTASYKDKAFNTDKKSDSPAAAAAGATSGGATVANGGNG